MRHARHVGHPIGGVQAGHIELSRSLVDELVHSGEVHLALLSTAVLVEALLNRGIKAHSDGRAIQDSFLHSTLEARS
jgi:hypothetical protein